MVHASLFSGIGGPEIAAAMIGWENAFHCEINPFCRTILNYWFPNAKSYEDITKTDFREWRGRIDVLTGGFPCQPFSYAGKRGGADDNRYLWPQMLRVIDEIRPTWVVGENVAGIATMVEDGRIYDLECVNTLFETENDFRRYEFEQPFTIERICKDLENIGYSVQPIVIPAACVNAPHRRDRIFIVANANGGNDVRKPGENEGESGKEGLQERDEIRVVGKSNNVSTRICEPSTNTQCDGFGGGKKHNGKKRRVNTNEIGNSKEDSNGFGFRGKSGISCDESIITNTNGEGRKEPIGPGREKDQEEVRTGLDDRIKRFGRGGNASNTLRPRCEGTDNAGESEENGKCFRGNIAGYDFSFDELQSGNKWKYDEKGQWIPSFSPIHRGNDGIPIRLDNLSISFSKWRTESLKAYGNAIVPQVMYEIFYAIDIVSSQK